MIKLIVSDMDGTLLNENVDISDANLSAIRRAQEEGIHFAIATGRDFPMADLYLREYDFSCPLILSNGAQFFDEKGTNVYNRGLEKKHVRQMLNMINGNPTLHVELVTTEGVYSDSKENRADMLASMLSDLNPDLTFEEAKEKAGDRIDEMEIFFVDRLEDVVDDESSVILKLTVHTLEGTDILEPVKEKLYDSIPDLAITSSSVKNLEINHVDAQKGIAVSQLAKELGLDSSQVMTIGDNLNDVSMLEWADYSVAVENAAPEAKAAAKFQTSSNRQNGVAEAISRVLNKSIYEEQLQN